VPLEIILDEEGELAVGAGEGGRVVLCYVQGERFLRRVQRVLADLAFVFYFWFRLLCDRFSVLSLCVFLHELLLLLLLLPLGVTGGQVLLRVHEPVVNSQVRLKIIEPSVVLLTNVTGVGYIFRVKLDVLLQVP